MTTTFTFISDPGHAWLAVDHDALALVNMTARDFSTFSYRHNDMYYLEEDCDAGKFLRAWEKEIGPVAFSEVHQEHTPIRGYRSIR